MQDSESRILEDGTLEVGVVVEGLQDADRIITLDDIIEKFGINLEDYEAPDFLPNSWETHFKVGDTIYRAVNYQAKARFKPNKAKLTTEALAKMLRDMMLAHSPPYKSVKRKEKDGEPTALVVDLYDLHIGMLAWAEETGSDAWDSHIGVAVAMEAIEKLISRLEGFNITQIIFPMGNDLIHTDTTIGGKGGATTANTPQDVDTRYLKMYRMAMELMVNIIDRLRLIAPVEVIIVPGNHDRERLAFMGENIAAWYRRDSEVDVNNDANLRKYTTFGNTLMGFTHGKDEKLEELPIIMAQEKKQDWAGTEYRVFHTGHIHHKRKMLSITTEDYKGVEVICIPSLVPPDSWHAMKGYVGSGRSAEAYLVGIDSGPCGHFRYNVPYKSGD